MEHISPSRCRLAVLTVRLVKQPLVKPPLRCLTASVSARSNSNAKVHNLLSNLHGNSVCNLTRVRAAVARYRSNWALSTLAQFATKSTFFTDYVTEVNMNLVAITETWLNTGEKDNKTTKDLTSANYKLVHLPRKSRRGGGVGPVYR